ncbi:odorant receptor 33a-like [Leptopilina boulardi]|uniref:odorant receptor 33a-like n=1 Tax=Leptopilina boulardi TaxID=63433 RepID=UPI0021F62CED|nr:odorant receptor 33a-like [Leptopilina boulardi]
MEILVSQFSLSLIIICFSGYKISNQSTLDYANIITLYSYILCILIQLFLFCWFGNELMLCSNNLQSAVYETDWLYFENKTKKSLIIIMIRTGRPILISAGSMVLVNLNSFVIILKTSYTAYNVLQHRALLIMFIIITVTLSLVCVTFFSVDGLKNSLFENLFLLLTLLNGCIKILVILIKKQKILSLITALAQYQPENIKEEKIQAEFDEEIKQITNVYFFIVCVSLITLNASVFLVDKNERIKTLNVWRPYDLNVNLYFWITLIHEFFGHLLMACCHICGDTLIPGIMIQISCQLKFLQQRVKNLPSKVEDINKSIKSVVNKINIEKNLIVEIIKHHNVLFTISKQLKETFVEILFFQFFLSLIVICFSIIKLSKGKAFDSTSLIIYPYLSAMLFQLFAYSWYGNLLMLNSVELQEKVPSVNWLSLEKETRKCIVILIIRSSRPILISVGSLIPVNLDSFVKILRASFSAFNVLKQTV